MRQTARRRERGQRRFRPLHAQSFATLCKSAGGVELVGAIRIARTRRTPWVIDRSRDFQHLLDLGIVVPHLAPIDWPIGAVAKNAARFEPFRSKTQR
jgi:hypothetical protein